MKMGLLQNMQQALLMVEMKIWEEFSVP